MDNRIRTVAPSQNQEYVRYTNPSGVRNSNSYARDVGYQMNQYVTGQPYQISQPGGVVGSKVQLSNNRTGTIVDTRSYEG